MGQFDQQFNTHPEWVRYASRWLTSHPHYDDKFFKVICYDALGRRCSMGAHFQRAHDEGTFPIRWWWPDQPIPELNLVLKHQLTDYLESRITDKPASKIESAISDFAETIQSLLVSEEIKEIR